MTNCKSSYNDGKYWQTVKLDNGLYIEVFKTFSQGGLGSDLIDDYLTDSLNFRVRLGTSDEYYEQVYCRPTSGDSIQIRRSRRGNDGKLKVVKMEDYSLKELRKLKNIDKSEVMDIGEI